MRSLWRSLFYLKRVDSDALRIVPRSMNTQQATSSSSLAVLLGVLFIGLKLCHVIDWSWFWVTAPLWGGFALASTLFAIFLVCSLTVLIVGLISTKLRKTRKS